MKPAPAPPANEPAGLLPRLGALFYDSLLLLAVWFCATAILLPFTHGEALQAGNPLYTSYLFMVSFFFYGWFWVRGGQTLGLRAWRLRVQRPDGRPITWLQALLRFFTALLSWAALGFGFWWILFDKRKRSWHDLYSETVTVRVPRDYLRSVH
jgi:uncharacterized RDD family membrane protein YckC